MQEESSSDFHFKKRFKKPKPPQNLTIPDPVDFFKVKVLNRPPSVPILGRRFSSESILNNHDDSPMQLARLPFKKYRRKSIPNRLSRRASVLHGKSESRCKLSHKQLDSRPPLDKSSKVLQIKSTKSLIKKSILSIPHISKFKQKMSKISVNPTGCRKIESSTPNRMARKNSDGKEHEEAKKNNLEHKGLVLKHDEGRFKTFHKSSKSALSMKPDFKKKKGEEKAKKKKKGLDEKNNNAVKAKAKKEEKKRRTGSSEGKMKKVKGKDAKKNVKKTAVRKAKESKHKKEEKIRLFQKTGEKQEWVDQSFDLNARDREVDILEFEENYYEDQENDNQISDLQASEIKLNLSIPSNDDKLSKFSSFAGFSLPDSQCRPKTPAPSDSFEQNSLKILKVDQKTAKKIEENSAILIQKCFRGYLAKKYYQNIEKIPNISPKNSQKKHIGCCIENSLTDSKRNSLFLRSAFEQPANDKSDFQAPKPSNNEPSSKVLSPLNEQVKLARSDLSSQSNLEKKALKAMGKDSKELENLLYLDSLKLKKANIEDLRRRDLEAIKKITPKTGSESEIFEIFQSIITRRYETINSMFDENIKAVQETLAQSIILEESFKVEELKKAKNKDFPLQTSETASIPAKLTEFKKQVQDLARAKTDPEPGSRLCLKANKHFIDEQPRHKSPEAGLTYLVFRSMPSPINQFITDFEPIPYKPRKPEPDHSSSKIVWVDEVAMPGNIDLTDLLIESAISETLGVILEDIIEQLFLFPASLVLELSEELILGILLNEVEEKVQLMKKDFSEDGIIEIIQKIFIKTQDLILEEVLKPLEKDPLAVMSEVQEAEIGCGFVPEEKYAMLNLEAFQEDVYHENEQVRIFNTMVFDCINDSLERLIVKEDLPWATARNSKTLVRSSEEVINYILNRLIGFSEIRAGEIGSQTKPESEISVKREAEITRILAIETVEEECEWVKYEKEELQSKLDLADMVLEQEIDSMVEVLFNERN